LTFEEFKKSVHEAPATALVNLSGALMALWHDSRGDWEAAHRAGRPFPDTDLKAEWEQISRSLLTQGHPG